jgi:hypothetical protein
MLLHADTKEAPAFLMIAIEGDWPTADERATFRKHLIESGFLRPETRLLVDLRGLTSLPAHGDVGAIVADSQRSGGLPRLFAYVVQSVDQIVLARTLKQFANGSIVGIFHHERAATEWLWNAHDENRHN